MIWASNHEGVVSYIGPEWAEFTGQAINEAVGNGWRAMVHPADATQVEQSFCQCCAEASTFTIQFRLKRVDGSYARVVSGAAPSHSPINGHFVGFLGALTEVSEIARNLSSESSLSGLFLPPPSGTTVPKTSIDIMTDHVLLARGAAERAGDKIVMASLDVTLSLIFVKLGGSRAAH